MKKLIILIISFLVFFSCKNSYKKENDYLIKGYITGYFEGKVVLGKYLDGKLVTIDSLFMTKSKFKFKHVKINTPELYYLIVDDGQIIIEFFMEPNHVQVNADYNKQGMVEVQGSKTHAEYVAFLENNVVFENKQSKIYEQKDIAMSNNDTALLTELETDFRAVSEEQMNFILKYVKENNESFVSTFIASRSLADYLPLNELEKITENFKDTVRTSVYYKELSDKIEVRKRTQDGMQAPDFSLPDTSETNISLSSLQGKYVLLDFAASWHGLSRSRNPEYKKLYDKFKPKGFEIFQACLERNKKQWKQVIEADKINWICVSDIKGLDSDVVKLYGIRTFPVNYLLDKNGKIIGSNLSAEELDEILKDIL
ncbi:MAG: AhpC/TSA family protein [Bacteroidales bacterium]|nr:AhpC/TSA family protein [Bacteroidales bacterium]